jgi:hypothetical protein
LHATSWSVALNTSSQHANKMFPVACAMSGCNATIGPVSMATVYHRGSMTIGSAALAAKLAGTRIARPPASSSSD